MENLDLAKKLAAFNGRSIESCQEWINDEGLGDELAKAMRVKVLLATDNMHNMDDRMTYHVNKEEYAKEHDVAFGKEFSEEDEDDFEIYYEYAYAYPNFAK